MLERMFDKMTDKMAVGFARSILRDLGYGDYATGELDPLIKSEGAHKPDVIGIKPEGAGVDD